MPLPGMQHVHGMAILTALHAREQQAFVALRERMFALTQKGIERLVIPLLGRFVLLLIVLLLGRFLRDSRCFQDGIQCASFWHG
jgi:hypothetical protein